MTGPLGPLGSSFGGHLGNRVSALLDGQLSADDAERAWNHVYDCHQCRDLVEREGWIKARLAGMSARSQALGCHAPDSAPDSLKGMLAGLTPGDLRLVGPHAVPGATPAASSSHTGRVATLAALGGGAVGAAVMGVLALGAAPTTDAPAITRQVVAPTQSSVRQGPVEEPAFGVAVNIGSRLRR